MSNADLVAIIERTGHDRSISAIDFRVLLDIAFKVLSAKRPLDRYFMVSVREVAQSLGVARASVSEAYQHLTAVGLIDTEVRGESKVPRTWVRLGPAALGRSITVEPTVDTQV